MGLRTSNVVEMTVTNARAWARPRTSDSTLQEQVLWLTGSRTLRWSMQLRDAGGRVAWLYPLVTLDEAWWPEQPTPEAARRAVYTWFARNTAGPEPRGEV